MKLEQLLEEEHTVRHDALELQQELLALEDKLEFRITKIEGAVITLGIKVGNYSATLKISRYERFYDVESKLENSNSSVKELISRFNNAKPIDNVINLLAKIIIKMLKSDIGEAEQLRLAAANIAWSKQGPNRSFGYPPFNNVTPFPYKPGRNLKDIIGRAVLDGLTVHCMAIMSKTIEGAAAINEFNDKILRIRPKPKMIDSSMINDLMVFTYATR